ncbi:unnamed protein product [Durusdinium trenchii]|uniref:Chloride channel protein n=1 Tax=Durusdinium trenchii TaxID=1381693 RepID=A0ABP0NNC8_9DINO
MPLWMSGTTTVFSARRAMAAASSSLTWRPQASPESLQMPERDARDGRRSPFGAAAAARATHSAVLGPQTHRLPSKVMWSVTMLTASAVALMNFGMILAIKWLVGLKFSTMQRAIVESGVLHGILVLVLISTSYAVVGVCLIQFVAPSFGGSGIPENKAFLNGAQMPGLYSHRTCWVRAGTNILANAAGFPVGREGPMVTIGSNLAYLLCEKVLQPYVREWVTVAGSPALLVDEQRLAHATRISCTVGGACAIAVIFNAPFGGLLYMFEEVTAVSWYEELTFRVFVSTMFCSLLSYGLCWLMGSDITEFVIYAETPQIKKWAWGDVPIFVALAALVGVLTSLHTRAMWRFAALRQSSRERWRRLQPWPVVVETTLYASLCAFTSGMVSLLAVCAKEGESGLEYVPFNCPEGQYNPIASLLVATSHSSVKLLFSGTNGGEIHASSSFLAFLTYTSLNIGLAGLPVPGGAFTATMLMGGLFGRSVGAFCHTLQVTGSPSGVYAVVGSAAMLCGFKQMTLASVLIVVECVNDLSLAPIVMLGVAVSMAVNWSMNERGHDEEVIHRRALPYLEPEAPHRFDALAALDLCSPCCPLLPEAPLAQVLSALEEEAHYFPVKEPDGPCLGIASRAAVKSLLPSSSQAEHVQLDSELVEELLPIHRVMDPTPFTVVEDMPAPRLYSLFAKAGERAACVTSIRGDFRGLISRERLIALTR